MPASTQVVACLGASTIHGKGQAYDIIADLRSRPANVGVRFLNFGVGGDLAYNALQRLPEVIAARPDKVIVLVGGDDVLATTFWAMRCFLAVTRRVLREPSAAWYEECLQQIARELKSKTAARVALCSLCPLGEDPESTNPYQHKLNKLLAEYESIIERVAREETLVYLPVYERLNQQILASPGQAFTDFRFLPMYRDAFRTVVLRRGLDEVGEMNGWRFHTDGIHLNARSGKFLADLLQTFVVSPAPS
jgi:lysophospholipase L1-like esterase